MSLNGNMSSGIGALEGSMATLNLDTPTNVLDHSPIPHKPVVKSFSTAGNAFLEKYVHPPSAVKNYIGIPDLNNFQVAPLEWRNLNVMNAAGIGYLGATTSDEFFSDNYLILSPSGARISTMCFSIGASSFTSGSTGAVIQDLRNTFVNDNYDFTRWPSDAMSSRMAYASTTIDLNLGMILERTTDPVAADRLCCCARPLRVYLMRTGGHHPRKRFEGSSRVRNRSKSGATRVALL
jgi:hypothetical protein